MAGTTPVHHSPYFLFQDQDIRRQSHSRRPHWTDDPSIISDNLNICYILIQVTKESKIVTIVKPKRV